MEGDISEIMTILNRLGGQTIEQEEENEMPTPLEVLESLRQTFKNFAEHDEMPEDIKKYLQFGADFIQRVIELKGLNEDEFTLELFMFAKTYNNRDELPY